MREPYSAGTALTVLVCANRTVGWCCEKQHGHECTALKRGWSKTTGAHIALANVRACVAGSYKGNRKYLDSQKPFRRGWFVQNRKTLGNNLIHHLTSHLGLYLGIRGIANRCEKIAFLESRPPFKMAADRVAYLCRVVRKRFWMIGYNDLIKRLNKAIG